MQQLYISLLGWRERELLALVQRNTKSSSREETLRKIFITGLKNVGAEMLKNGQFAMDRLTRSEVGALFCEDKEPGYTPFRTSAISRSSGPGITGLKT